MSCELQRTQAECMKLFVRAARRIFSEILQFFRAILAQHLRDLDAERALFSEWNALSIRTTSADVLQHAQRLLAECTQFLCARRAGFPEILQFLEESREFGAKFA